MVATVIALAGAACERSPKPDAELSCFQARIADTGSSGSNPLLSGQITTMCFDGLKDCDLFRAAKAPRDPSAGCRALREPSWHCYSTKHRGPTSDPLNNVTTCLPTKALCDASRPDPKLAKFDALGDLVSGPCVPVETVSCETGRTGAVSCYADNATCKLVKGYTEAVLPTLQRSSECAPRRSVVPAR